MPSNGFDFKVVVLYDKSFLQYVAEWDHKEAHHIAWLVAFHASYYFDSHYAVQGLGTKLHFIVEEIEHMYGYRVGYDHGKYLR